jgi:hypothetical protein
MAMQAAKLRMYIPTTLAARYLWKLYFRDPIYPAYVFFATIETVCTSVIIWQAWTWSAVEAAVSSERIVSSPG